MHILRTADGYLVGGYRMDTTFPVVAFTCAYLGGSSFSPSGHPTLISIINSARISFNQPAPSAQLLTLGLSNLRVLLYNPILHLSSSNGPMSRILL